jgi:serine/threonine protein kinase
MSEKLSSLDEFHEEINSVFILKDKFHVYKEGVVDCVQDIFLEANVFELIVLKDNIFSNAFHSVVVLSCVVLDKEHFTKGPLSNHFQNVKVSKGGELFRHFVQVKRFPEDHVKFFAAQVALALGHLHENKIIYRDLKPENILVSEDGYLMVADFGLAKFVQNGEMANSFCGTAEYLAPEMLIGNGHDYTVDWWALGILIYEMIVGIPPFFNRNKHKMYNLIKSGTINFPDKIKHKIDVSPVARDVICKLLHKDKK